VRDLGRYVMRRLLQLLPILFGILLVNFLLVHLAPGDPIQILAGDFAPSAEYAARLRAEFGLDRPLFVQAAIYFGRLLRGDLGYSIAFKQPVASLILERLGPTVALSGVSLMVATVAGIVLGVAAALRPRSLVDVVASLAGLVGYSVPVFWLAQLLLIVFALQLRWFPAQGMASFRQASSGLPYLADVLHHLVLPVATLTAFHLAIITRFMRVSMLEVLAQDFVRTARAKGVGESSVVYRHALRNALLPVTTVVGTSLGMLLSGAVLTETVFGWPGLGRLLYEAVLKRDYPVMMGMLLVIAASVMIANLVIDVAYALIDPRVRYG
jgi:ABC-type dipeptide/oligopeptide/nickel transport system permease component